MFKAIFKIATFNSPKQKRNAALPDKLQGFIQKWLTAGVDVRQVIYNSLCSKNGYLQGVLTSVDK